MESIWSIIKNNIDECPPEADQPWAETTTKNNMVGGKIKEARSIMEKRKILQGLTTTFQNGDKDQWRKKIAEIDKLEIKEIALFPTVLKRKERKELYVLLEKTGIERVPHVHLRDDDMEKEELDYLVERYKVQVFNLHPTKKAFAFFEKYPKYRGMTFIENLYQVVKNERFSENDFQEHKAAGICLDMAHLRSEQLLFP